MENKPRKKVFIDGPISAEMIAQSIEKHSTMHGIGAHSIFLGQVRADELDQNKVVAIEYSCYAEMADEVFHTIREETFSKFQLSCMHIYHSIGLVKTGQISLFVFTSSKHRAMATQACSFVVEQIKSKAPVWGKELFEDKTYTWKKNNSNL
jgi:molybdopterin synthase catalytic subunit